MVFFAGTDLLHYTQEQNTDFNTTFIQILVGGIGVFTLFGISQFGLSQILYASKSLYTKKAKAEADIQFATEIQKRILQEVLIEHQNIRAYASSFPANELGGDFFELSLHDNELFASIGDISGHSFGAGLLMTLTKSALQTHLDYNRDPKKIMGALNNTLNRQTERSMYATMTLLKLNITDRKATLCNAGHLPILHIPKETNEIIHRYEKGLGLGITETAHFKNLEFDLEKGDRLILYSDGLVETRDENLKIRDTAFFEELVYNTLKSESYLPEELSSELLKKVRESDYSSQMEDDCSLIVIEV